ncbi:hypothetical protein [Burkholderia oklahomensis]|uniref:hypothetical protein n=1 Tax=Burkholderia oklahomensis TaxID=342113 RepID=UPI0013923032|nr:hypothetical protein [Burkholderia oklahomensis]
MSPLIRPMKFVRFPAVETEVLPDTFSNFLPSTLNGSWHSVKILTSFAFRLKSGFDQMARSCNVAAPRRHVPPIRALVAALNRVRMTSGKHDFVAAEACGKLVAKGAADYSQRG